MDESIISPDNSNASSFDTRCPAYVEAAKCNKCGFCQEKCPVFRVTGSEAAVARGRNVVVRGILEGRVELTPEIKSYLFECLLCRGCTSVCFPAIRTDEIMAAARAAYVAQYGQPAILSFLFRKVLPDRERLGRYARLMRLGKRSGLSGLTRLMRIFGIYGKSLATANDLVKRMPRRFLLERLEDIELSPEGTPGHKVALFLGCAMNYSLPDACEAAIRVLVANGCEVSILDNVCCGLPAYAYGDTEALVRVAAKNLEVFRAADADFIWTECASCSAFLKEYPRVLPPGEERRAAEELAGKVRDFTEVAHSLRPLQGLGEMNVRVTYHDPCHLSKYQELAEAPRELLRMIPGVEYVELPEADWCCGGAGSYNIAHYDLSMKVLDRKMDNIEKTQADVVATACPACMIQLAYGVRKRGLNMQVQHVAEALARAMEPAEEDAD